jgi:hypothetical protein
MVLKTWPANCPVATHDEKSDYWRQSAKFLGDGESADRRGSVPDNSATRKRPKVASELRISLSRLYRRLPALTVLACHVCVTDPGQ